MTGRTLTSPAEGVPGAATEGRPEVSVVQQHQGGISNHCFLYPRVADAVTVVANGFDALGSC